MLWDLRKKKRIATVRFSARRERIAAEKRVGKRWCNRCCKDVKRIAPWLGLSTMHVRQKDEGDEDRVCTLSDGKRKNEEEIEKREVSGLRR